MTLSRTILAWGALALFVAVPVLVAALSPLHAYRPPSYVAASLAGVLALGVLLIQPLLKTRPPGVAPARLRRWHRRTGFVLVVLVAVHVGGLLIASPPDAIDALLLRSPTPFSVWGVTSMWAVVLSAVLVALRRKMRLRPATWAAIHNVLALVVVLGTVIHAVQIEGTMGTVSKWALCLAALAAAIAAVARARFPGISRRGT
ncbi:ferric reductase-like transmembrane domain-containing protein [Allosediminivita pacifica]|uniref:Ferric reductase like protein n=1 Tax=Allosediminivita pacifica TaxID=1267769 RepID=A0A2T6AT20_9RHOB|nr:ferric reductase-like transmembrane domain-containing protein [Allosediminivita pacifica]PTX46886.1 ferric reductase like protein [Allosediminivita pacifica]GGB15477.1 ferric reductase [Allosediminivita pacifica]